MVFTCTCRRRSYGDCRIRARRRTQTSLLTFWGPKLTLFGFASRLPDNLRALLRLLQRAHCLPERAVAVRDRLPHLRRVAVVPGLHHRPCRRRPRQRWAVHWGFYSYSCCGSCQASSAADRTARRTVWFLEYCGTFGESLITLCLDGMHIDYRSACILSADGVHEIARWPVYRKRVLEMVLLHQLWVFLTAIPLSPSRASRWEPTIRRIHSYTHFVTVPIGAVSAAGVLWLLHVKQNLQPLDGSILQNLARFDPIGSAIFFSAVVCVLLACQLGGVTYPYSNARIIALFTLFGVLLVALVLWETWNKKNALSMSAQRFSEQCPGPARSRLISFLCLLFLRFDY